MTDAAGQLFSGARLNDYLVDHELSAKPGQIAYAATHALLPRRARLLSLHPTFTGLQTIAVQLMHEACILEALHHPGVPRVYECGMLGDRRPWIAVELIEGPTIAVELATRGALPVADVIELMRDLAEILDYAHARGLVHRNLRPDVIARRPEGPCILDWSDARGHDAAACPPVPPDSLEYQAPEVAGGDPVDHRGDVYSLGVIAYEALSLALPTVSAARRCPGVSPALTALIDRMLALDPRARPSAAEVRAEAISLVDLIDIPAPADDDDAIDEVEIELETLPPVGAPRDAKLRWTPADGYLAKTAPHGRSALEPRRRQS